MSVFNNKGYRANKARLLCENARTVQIAYTNFKKTLAYCVNNTRLSCQRTLTMQRMNYDQLNMQKIVTVSDRSQESLEVI